MTRAPQNLLDVRRLLLTYLNVDESRSRDADLEPAEVGIVGDPAHRGGYHCGSDRVVAGDYSVLESDRDRNGLSAYASALDVGWFKVGVGSRTYDLRHLSVWCVNQCAAGAADARDIREIIYSPDGKTVRRWDRLGRRSSGDTSHLWHTHFSFFRDATKAGRDLTPLFRRYLTTIGLIAAPPPPKPATPPAPEVPDMQLSDKIGSADRPDRTVGDVLRDLSDLRNYLIGPPMAGRSGAPMAGSPLLMLTAMAQAWPAFAARDFTDEQAIVAGVLAGIDPATLAQRIVEAMPAEQARRFADELARRLAD
ncbi:hypothetical protein [Micromonospora chalcea]|uniref:hypothetical protein n=1 Tax=Micromonospora chalcea TaxID=1874 RepID=UPI003D76459F